MRKISLDDVVLEKKSFAFGASAHLTHGRLRAKALAKPTSMATAAKADTDTEAEAEAESDEARNRDGWIPVVVKTVNTKDRSEELRAEKDAYACLERGSTSVEHSHGKAKIRRVYGEIDESAGNRLVMERMDACLSDVLDGGHAEVSRWLPAAATTTAALMDMAEGLSALHASGVAHCDVRPPNVLLSRDGARDISSISPWKPVDQEQNQEREFPPTSHAKVADLGTSDRIGARFEPDYVHRRSKLVHLTADRTASPHIDVHGLGVIILEMLSARNVGTRSELTMVRRALEADIAHYNDLHEKASRECCQEEPRPPSESTSHDQVLPVRGMRLLRKRPRTSISWLRPALANDMLVTNELWDVAVACLHEDPASRPSMESVLDRLAFAGALAWF